MTAIIRLNKEQQEELHNYERPISYLAFQQAEMNRDSKKQRKPYKLSDYYFYDDKSLSNMPEPRYGAAALALIQSKQYPAWGLFVYKDLKDRAKDALPPELLCVQCEDAILLAPNIDGNTISGMLIACETASNQTRTMVSPCGLEVEVVIPRIENKYEAKEDQELKLLKAKKNPEPS